MLCSTCSQFCCSDLDVLTTILVTLGWTKSNCVRCQSQYETLLLYDCNQQAAVVLVKMRGLNGPGMQPLSEAAQEQAATQFLQGYNTGNVCSVILRGPLCTANL
jgi:hypothetical protein